MVSDFLGCVYCVFSFLSPILIFLSLTVSLPMVNGGMNGGFIMCVPEVELLGFPCVFE